MKKMNKFVSMLLVVAMIFAMSITAFAATTDPHMTADAGQWTVSVTPGQSVTLYASPATSYYTASGFSNATDAMAVTWVSSNTAIATVGTISAATVNDASSSLNGLLCSAAVVTVPTTATIGSCSIQATNPENGEYVNFTIVVNSNATSDVANITVYVPDLAGYSGFSASTVNHSAAHFATPVDAMYALKNASGSEFSFNDHTSYPSDSYINDITCYGVYLEDNYPDSMGWGYRVYRQNGNDSYLVADSAVIAVNAFKLESNDTIVWLYGDYTYLETAFPNTLSQLTD